MTQTFYAPDRDTWREWLEEHGNRESEVWLVYYKAKTGHPTISYNDSLEEALCFGWVDSIIQRIDEEKYARKFTPRKPGSHWSEVNQHLAARLVKEGRMTEAGLAKVDFPLEEVPAARPKRPTTAHAGLDGSWPEGQPQGLGKLLQAAALPTTQLHPVALGRQAGGDAPAPHPGSHRQIGKEREAWVVGGWSNVTILFTPASGGVIAAEDGGLSNIKA